MLLHIAYKAEKGLDLRQENSHRQGLPRPHGAQGVDTAIQLHGALGYSQDTPLAAWYTHIRSQRLVDGPDEVHRWTIGRNVIKAFREHGTTASAAAGICCNRRYSAGATSAVSLPGSTRQSIPLKTLTKDDGCPGQARA